MAAFGSLVRLIVLVLLLLLLLVLLLLVGRLELAQLHMRRVHCNVQRPPLQHTTHHCCGSTNH
jgi:hypothetical protein